ncbi:hypothetical protein BC827DRAFT_1305409 [Russula dissimulans]|nr:hypothetical protein BC827DRAFT_1305409 [Russula dissimulans]
MPLLVVLPCIVRSDCISRFRCLLAVWRHGLGIVLQLPGGAQSKIGWFFVTTKPCPSDMGLYALQVTVQKSPNQGHTYSFAQVRVVDSLRGPRHALSSTSTRRYPDHCGLEHPSISARVRHPTSISNTPSTMSCTPPTSHLVHTRLPQTEHYRTLPNTCPCPRPLLPYLRSPRRQSGSIEAT